MEGSARRFHIDTCLGRGGFGEVYKARMTRSGGFEVEVALKLLRADVDPRGHAASRLRDEARMLGMVRHRCVPQVFDLVELDGRMALVSEYVEGADLSKCLRAAPRLPRRACLEALAGVTDALYAAYHTPVRGGGFTRIVHRDLKPANVRIARDGTPKLLDFGIAWTDAVTRVAMTQSSALVGSPAYMAPERFDAAPPTAAVDVFGLGAMLYEVLTGKRLFAEVPFKELAAIALVESRYARALDERLHELPDDTPAELRALVAETLAFAPGTRPPTAEVARRLEALATRAPGPTLVAWCRDRTWADEVGVGGAWCGRTLIEGQPAGAPVSRTSGWEAGEPQLLLTPDLPTLASGPQTLADASLSAVVPAPAPAAWSRAALLVPVVLGVLAAGLWGATRPAAPAPAQLAAVTGPSASAAPSAVQPPTPASLAPAPAALPEPSSAARATAAPRTSTRHTPADVPLARVDALLAADEDPPAVEAPAPAARPAPTTTEAPPAAPVATAAPAPAPTTSAFVRSHERADGAASASDSAAPSTTRVSLDAATRATDVTLVGMSGRWRLPASVAPGRYQVQADFGVGVLQGAGSVEIGSAPVSVRCAMNHCAIVR